MSHSLKSKLSGLRYKGYITTDEYKRLKNALDIQVKTGHWIEDLIAKVLEEVDGGTDDKYIRYNDICDRVTKSIKEYFSAKMIEPQESEVQDADSNQYQ